jgi:hypothetical protein
MRADSNTRVVSTTVADLDRLVAQLGQVRHLLVLPLARASSLLASRRAWFEFGYRNQDDYARERLRRSGRWLRKLVSLHTCFARFPVLSTAATGLDGKRALGRSVALEVGRLATEQDIESRIRLARGLPESYMDPASPDRGATRGLARDLEREARGDGSEPETKVVRVELPPEIRLALDEVLELHRAVSGRQASIANLVEGLIADAAAGGWSPPDVTGMRSLRSQDHKPGAVEPVAGRVDAVARRAPVRHTGERCSGFRSDELSRVPAARRSAQTLTRYVNIARRLAHLSRYLDRGPGVVDSPEATPGANRSTRPLLELERTMRKLICMEDEIETRLGELLLALAEQRAWHQLGFGNLADYAHNRLRLSRASANRRVSLARSLRCLPQVRDAYESGRIGAQAAAWFARRSRAQFGVRGDDEQRAWIEHAETTTLKRLEDEARLVRQADLLRRASQADAMAASTRWRSSAVGTESAQNVPTDAEWHASLRRMPGAAQDRVAALGHAVLRRVLARSALLPVRWSVSLPEPLALQFLACINAASRALVQATTATTTSAADDARLGPALRIARFLVERRQPLPAWVGLLALCEEYAGTWDDPAGMPRRPTDEVCHRDGARCMAPGCTSRRDLQVHHARYRSRGGTNALWNLVLLCVFHHLRGEHGGLARCRGTAPLDLVWRLGKRGLATWFRNERRLGALPV